jgi:hypothetical protein
MQKIKTIIKVWLPFAVTISAFCALTYASVQQAYRQGANDPQIQMAEDGAAAMNNGAPVEAVVPSTLVDVEHSLSPFIILYDANGQVVKSSGLMGGSTPKLPAGVLDNAKQNGLNRVTWQPQAGVRIAAVIIPYTAKGGGFVLAGRSLREVEIREDQTFQFAAITWGLALVATLIVIAFGEFFLTEKK